MEAMTYSSARKNFATAMEQVCDNHNAIIITRKSAGSVVMMSLDDYNAIEETAYLLRSPANAQNLRESIKQYEQGKYKNRKLIEE